MRNLAVNKSEDLSTIVNNSDTINVYQEIELNGLFSKKTRE